MCELHDQERDHIWGYYVRNLVRPVWLARPDNRVDVLVGNPPWLAYRYMTKVQKKSFFEMSAERKLWAGASLATSQDLSALFVARCIELYLKTGGRFGYVMPRGTLTLGHYERFRRGRYSIPVEQVTVAFDLPWDLDQVKPAFFTQSVSVLFGCRTSSTTRELGRRSDEWSGRFNTKTATLAEATKYISRRIREPTPTGKRSPYENRFFQGAAVVPQVLFLVKDEDVGLLGAGLNRRAVQSRRSANEHQPWRDLRSLHGIIEEKFIKHLYLGACMLPFRSLRPREAVIPWDGHLLGVDDIDLYPGLAAWWRAAENAWRRKRSGSQLSLLQQLDYRRKLSQQFPVAGYRVVYPKSAMYCAAAVIANVDNEDALIDQQLYWGQAATLDEARYLTAILNAPVLTSAVQELQPRGEHNPRDIAKYIFQLPIPLYDPNDAAHQELIALAVHAEHVAAAVALPDVRFEALRRRVRQALADDGVTGDIDMVVGALLT
jgi:hypothetical protein